MHAVRAPLRGICGHALHILRNLALPDDRCVLLETEEERSQSEWRIQMALRWHSASSSCIPPLGEELGEAEQLVVAMVFEEEHLLEEGDALQSLLMVVLGARLVILILLDEEQLGGHLMREVIRGVIIMQSSGHLIR